jgi:hypothetical protein
MRYSATPFNSNDATPAWQPCTTAQPFTINNLAAGSYYVQVRECCNQCTTSVNLVVLTCSNREDNATLDGPPVDFNAYPNPVKEILNIEFSSTDEATVKLKLVDVLGQTVIEHLHPATIGNNQYQMNLATIAKGVYILVMQKGDATLQKKIVLQ